MAQLQLKSCLTIDCRSWKRGISLGITKLQPRLQSPLGNHVSLYLTKLRWDEIKQLLVMHLLFKSQFNCTGKMIGWEIFNACLNLAQI